MVKGYLNIYIYILPTFYYITRFGKKNQLLQIEGEGQFNPPPSESWFSSTPAGKGLTTKANKCFIVLKYTCKGIQKNE